jgi:hypothetical protein
VKQTTVLPKTDAFANCQIDSSAQGALERLQKWQKRIDLLKLENAHAWPDFP